MSKYFDRLMADLDSDATFNALLGVTGKSLSEEQYAQLYAAYQAHRDSQRDDTDLDDQMRQALNEAGEERFCV